MSDYKLVPVEPTSDMLCSGIDAYGIEDCLDADVHAIYTSMIGAAPAGQGEPVGEAGALRGASGFTTAVFESSKAPEGTKLYASPRHAEQKPAPDVAGLVEALERAVNRLEGAGLFYSEAAIRGRAILAAHCGRWGGKP